MTLLSDKLPSSQKNSGTPMSEIHTITEVKVIKDKVLYLKFSNGA
jgi:hypothetical protein